MLEKFEDPLKLARRKITVQELEHRWIARELHDSVVQILSSAKFRLQLIHAESIKGSKNITADIIKAKNLIGEALYEIRRISQNLRPTLLDDFGLVKAAKELCEDFKERTKIEIRLKFPHRSKQLPNDIELTLYRILQESLNNVEKHSRASEVKIELTVRSNDIYMRIKDNGKGFDFAQTKQKKKAWSGLGLRHIQERVLFMRGTAVVDSQLGLGTAISVLIPLKRRATDFASTK